MTLFFIDSNSQLWELVDTLAVESKKTKKQETRFVLVRIQDGVAREFKKSEMRKRFTPFYAPQLLETVQMLERCLEAKSLSLQENF